MNGDDVHVRSVLILKLNANISLVSASEIRILWEDPYENKGYFDAVAVEVTKAKYVTTTKDIIIPGMWKFEVRTVLGGNLYRGAVANLVFEDTIDDYAGVSAVVNCGLRVTCNITG